LLCNDKLQDLFYAKTGPIYTKTKDSPPTKYGENANVKCSLIASGCTIEGTVENSIIFRGVKIGKNAVIKNSIILQHGTIGENTRLDSVIADTYSFIKPDRILLGYSNCPFFIKKNSII
jgi:glucose-1-phosphate adenylyltransferase